MSASDRERFMKSLGITEEDLIPPSSVINQPSSILSEKGSHLQVSQNVKEIGSANQPDCLHTSSETGDTSESTYIYFSKADNISSSENYESLLPTAAVFLSSMNPRNYNFKTNSIVRKLGKGHFLFSHDPSNSPDQSSFFDSSTCSISLPVSDVLYDTPLSKPIRKLQQNYFSSSYQLHDSLLAKRAMQDTLINLKERGNFHFFKGEYFIAVQFYSLALRNDPKNVILLSNRSAAYLHSFTEMGSVCREHALNDSTLVTNLAPKWFKGYSRTGDALFKLGRFSEAVNSYAKALALDPGNETLTSSLISVSFMLRHHLLRQKEAVNTDIQGNRSSVDKINPLNGRPNNSSENIEDSCLREVYSTFTAKNLEENQPIFESTTSSETSNYNHSSENSNQSNIAKHMDCLSGSEYCEKLLIAYRSKRI